MTLISLEITLEGSDLEQNATADSMLQDRCLVITRKANLSLAAPGAAQWPFMDCV